MKKASVRFTACFLAVLPAGFVGATPVSVDRIVYPELTAANPGAYAGTVDTALSGNVLAITLTNMSMGGVGPEGVGNRLTGIGFDLPDGVGITGGSVSLAPGWTFGHLFNSGAFQTSALMDGNFVDNAGSVMKSETTNRFADGSRDAPRGFAGPDFGLLSDAVNGAILGRGNEGFQWSVITELTLRGRPRDDFIAQFQAGDVVLSFGSPTVRSTPVPEPATLALLCLGGLFGLAGLKRRKK